jgi:SlyX protein
MSKQTMAVNTIEQALESLEIKLAYQEDTIEMLNQTVIQQQDKINNLQHLLGKMAEKINSMPSSESPASDEIELPPHY